MLEITIIVCIVTFFVCVFTAVDGDMPMLIVPGIFCLLIGAALLAEIAPQTQEAFRQIVETVNIQQA